jgi:hypothetical protein
VYLSGPSLLVSAEVRTGVSQGREVAHTGRSRRLSACEALGKSPLRSSDITVCLRRDRCKA